MRRRKRSPVWGWETIPQCQLRTPRDIGHHGPVSSNKVLPARDVFSHLVVSSEWGLFCVPSPHLGRNDAGCLPASTHPSATESFAVPISLLPASSSTSPSYMGPYDWILAKGMWAEVKPATSRPGLENLSCHPLCSLPSSPIFMQRIPGRDFKALEAGRALGGRSLGSGITMWKASPKHPIRL